MKFYVTWKVLSGLTLRTKYFTLTLHNSNASIFYWKTCVLRLIKKEILGSNLCHENKSWRLSFRFNIRRLRQPSNCKLTNTVGPLECVASSGSTTATVTVHSFVDPRYFAVLEHKMHTQLDVTQARVEIKAAGCPIYTLYFCTFFSQKCKTINVC